MAGTDFSLTCEPDVFCNGAPRFITAWSTTIETVLKDSLDTDVQFIAPPDKGEDHSKEI